MTQVTPTQRAAALADAASRLAHRYRADMASVPAFKALDCNSLLFLAIATGGDVGYAFTTPFDGVIRLGNVAASINYAEFAERLYRALVPAHPRGAVVSLPHHSAEPKDADFSERVSAIAVRNWLGWRCAPTIYTDAYAVGDFERNAAEAGIARIEVPAELTPAERHAMRLAAAVSANGSKLGRRLRLETFGRTTARPLPGDPNPLASLARAEDAQGMAKGA
jgi:hypothetical protein